MKKLPYILIAARFILAPVILYRLMAKTKDRRF